MSFLFKNLSKIKPSPTIAVSMKAAELKSQGKDVIGLGTGEPDFDTPDNIKNAAIEAIKKGDTKYTAVSGTKDLKNAIISKFKRENNLEYIAEEIIVSTGAKQVIYNALIATMNEGDEVLIPAPYWASYPDMVLLAGGTPIVVNDNSGNNFKITADILSKKITPKSKWLILNSPSNPTGVCYNEVELRDLADLLLGYPNLHIMTDDIYEHLVFDNFKFKTLAEIESKLKDRCLVVNGVSKAYAMTGWRIGYAGGNKDLIKAMTKIQSQSTSSPCSISQAAAVEALNGDQSYISDSRIAFQERRNMVVDMLNDIAGINCNKPNGAFYVFPSCVDLFGKKTPNGNVINSSTDFATYLLDYALVAIVPGIAFGSEGFFRISYAESEKVLTEAINRIKKACAELK